MPVGSCNCAGVHTLCALETRLKVADKTPGVSGTCRFNDSAWKKMMLPACASLMLLCCLVMWFVERSLKTTGG